MARHGAATTGVGLALTTALAGLASWGALTLGVHACHAGSLNGALLAVLALVPLAAFELASPLPAATQSLQRSRVAAARVFEAMDAPAVVNDPARPVTLDDAPHTLVLRDVWASYPGAGRAALRGVDLQLTPGRRVALVGPSGAGKSTLADVLVRFLPADAGKRRWTAFRWSASPPTTCAGSSGWSSRTPTSSTPHWRRISGLAGVTSSDAELSAALGQVGLGGWLAGLPDGLATAVGAQGGRLSGGQRQRIAVARALLAEFPILLLDEPCEHLDPPAADALTADLLTLTEGRSTLLITHRLAGLEEVDEIVLIVDGRVLERGTTRSPGDRRPLRRPLVG